MHEIIVVKVYGQETKGMTKLIFFPPLSHFENSAASVDLISNLSSRYLTPYGTRKSDFNLLPNTEIKVRTLVHSHGDSMTKVEIISKQKRFPILFFPCSCLKSFMS